MSSIIVVVIKRRNKINIRGKCSSLDVLQIILISAFSNGKVQYCIQLVLYKFIFILKMGSKQIKYLILKKIVYALRAHPALSNISALISGGTSIGFVDFLNGAY